MLGRIIGADGEAVKPLGEGVDPDRIVRDLAHDVELQPVLPAPQ